MTEKEATINLVSNIMDGMYDTRHKIDMANAILHVILLCILIGNLPLALIIIFSSKLPWWLYFLNVAAMGIGGWYIWFFGKIYTKKREEKDEDN